MSWVDNLKVPEPPKWDPSDCATFWAAVKQHFSKRTVDYPWLANGPRSEVWYTTELIAALGNASPLTWMAHRIMGEETYAEIDRNLGRSSETNRPHARRRPDLNIVSGYSSGQVRVTVLCEAKVLVNEDIDADLAGAILDEKGLLEQLKRGKECFPNAACFGLVFVQWLDGRHYKLNGREGLSDFGLLLGHCAKYVDEAMMSADSAFGWCSHDIEKVISPPALGTPHDKTQNRAGLGIGLIKLGPDPPADEGCQ